MFRVLAFLLLAVLPAAACKWDRDTLLEESKGKMDTIKAITGWFARYPARYYEMRLARVTEELKQNPGKLDLYDDAGVACDNMGRHDEAIAWMEKKKAVLDTRPPDETKTERYRYLANLGSFLGNRWAERPAAERNADPSDLRAAAECINEAVALNPDAHFGREVYQLLLFNWLLQGFNEEKPATDTFLPSESSLPAPKWHEAEAGLAGLIQLGSAWESVDVYEALIYLFRATHEENLGLLVQQRLDELEQEGKESLYPGARRQSVEFGGLVRDKEQVKAWYIEARAASSQRMNAWLAYQEERFAKGMHPDTNPDFWSEWQEPRMPAFPEPSLRLLVEREPGKAMGILVVLISGCFIISRLLMRSARRRNAPLPTS